jgi:hypothetical protein
MVLLHTRPNGEQKGEMKLKLLFKGSVGCNCQTTSLATTITNTAITTVITTGRLSLTVIIAIDLIPLSSLYCATLGLSLSLNTICCIDHKFVCHSHSTHSRSTKIFVFSPTISTTIIIRKIKWSDRTSTKYNVLRCSLVQSLQLEKLWHQSVAE